MTPAVGFPPGFYSQYPPPPGRPGEGGPAYFPPVYFTPAPPLPPNADGEATQYQPSYYPAAFIPYGQPFPHFMVPHQRSDGQMAMAPYPMYQQKPPSAGGPSEPGSGSKGQPPEAELVGDQEDDEEEAGDD